MNPDSCTRNYREIIGNFDFSGEFVDIQPYGYGHINETFLVRCQQKSGKINRYILQRINHLVFHDPAAVMHNYSRITDFLRQKIIQAGGDPTRETINLVKLTDGRTFLQTQEGEYWRAELFIKNAQTYQFPERPDHLYNAAWAFGNFGKMLANFPVEELNTTIPNFHHTPKRFQAFLSALASDSHNRAKTAEEEIQFLLERAADTHVLVDLYDAGKIPSRVTHNDTKFENVMMDDETGKGICVIDLDTVMPGIILFDFADTVRSSASTAAEDEPNLEKVNFRLDIFDQLAQGYLDAARDYLLPIEVEYLAFSSRLITLEQGLRFLTDFLNGDTYYRTRYPQHNLIRCRTQLKLVKDMEKYQDEMIEIINHRLQG